MDKDDFRVSDPIKSERVIHVVGLIPNHEDLDKNLEYHGLPKYWR